MRDFPDEPGGSDDPDPHDTGMALGEAYGVETCRSVEGLFETFEANSQDVCPACFYRGYLMQCMKMAFVSAFAEYGGPDLKRDRFMLQVMSRHAYDEAKKVFHNANSNN